MNEEMAQLKKDVEHWLKLEKETYAELQEMNSVEAQRWKGRIEAYEHTIVMINSVTFLFGHSLDSEIKATTRFWWNWGKKK